MAKPVIKIIASDRKVAADIAQSQRLSASTIKKYLEGKNDDAAMLQGIAAYRTDLDKTSRGEIQRLTDANAALTKQVENLSVNYKEQVGLTNYYKSESTNFRNTLVKIKTRVLGSFFGRKNDLIKLVDDSIYTPVD